MARDRQWTDAIAVADIYRGDATPVTVAGRALAIYDTHDGITASHARCTHGAANLCDGYFDGKYIECPLHQGLFDARTGHPRAAPARVPLRMVETRVENGMIQVLI